MDETLWVRDYLQTDVPDGQAAHWWQLVYSEPYGQAFPIHGRLLTFWHNNFGYRKYGAPSCPEYNARDGAGHLLVVQDFITDGTVHYLGYDTVTNTTREYAGTELFDVDRSMNAVSGDDPDFVIAVDNPLHTTQGYITGVGGPEPDSGSAPVGEIGGNHPDPAVAGPAPDTYGYHGSDTSAYLTFTGDMPTAIVLRGLEPFANLVQIVVAPTGRGRDAQPLPNVWMARFELTQEQLAALVPEFAHYYSGDENLPVRDITLAEVQTFCTRLNQSLQSYGYQVRIPSVDEWITAMRWGMRDDAVRYFDEEGGVIHYRYGQDGYETRARLYEWCRVSNSIPTAPRYIGSMLPNPLNGLSDTLGNVCEMALVNANTAAICGGMFITTVDHLQFTVGDETMGITGRKSFVGVRLLLETYTGPTPTPTATATATPTPQYTPTPTATPTPTPLPPLRSGDELALHIQAVSGGATDGSLAWFQVTPSSDFWTYSVTLRIDRTSLPAGTYLVYANVRASNLAKMAVVLCQADNTVVSTFNPWNGMPRSQLYPGVTDQYLEIRLPQASAGCSLALLFGNSNVLGNSKSVLIRRWRLTYLGP